MNDALEEMTSDECWTRLAENPLGRLVLTAAGEIDIYPVNFVVSNGRLFLRTAPGTKLLELTVNPKVLLEVDHVDEEIAYSVVVKGVARELQHQAEIDEADALPLKPWAPTLKYRWVVVTPSAVTGRLFHRADEPARY